MSAQKKSRPKHRILVVDDEEDIHQITKISLKGLRYLGKRLEFLFATSGSEAVEVMRREADVGVVLLDVVMETNTSGLEACRAIREELGNRMVRILLRTGQPGAAPEKNVIQEYDIDGYLPKAELTADFVDERVAKAEAARDASEGAAADAAAKRVADLQALKETI